ncbi:FAD binding domain protein [Diplocarpon mali]|nr:FAD binding domain protein [Diplocarpon mali]
MSEWDSLNSTLSGHLIKTVLPGSVCYSSEPNYSVAACERVIANSTESAFVSSDPASIHSPNFADNACNPIYPNGTSISKDPTAGSRGCTIGKYPPYVVNATGASDVQAAVKFATKWNLRFNIKNTGHSYTGGSTAYGSLSIWTHNLKGFEFHEDFKLQSCSVYGTGQQLAASVGAGLQVNEAYSAAAEHGAVVVGAADHDVGLAGWAAGGGHGWLSSTYGLGADNILEAEVVTPTGDILTVNPCQNPDLFWALRGGGGGTFGIVTKMTVKAYPQPQATTWNINISQGNNTSVAEWWELVANFFSHLPALKEGGLQGFFSIGGAPSYPSLNLFGIFFAYDKPNGTVEALVAPLKAYLESTADKATYSSTVAGYATWFEAYSSFPLQKEPQGGWAFTSRFLPARSLTDDPALLARVLEDIGPSREAPTDGVSNAAMAGCVVASTVPVDNALNPAWRETIVHFQVSRTWLDDLPAATVERTYDDITNNRGSKLRQLAPDTGAYFNEADPYEPDWQNTLFGKNYPRLQFVKQKYDPNGLLWCPHCVGSEEWVEAEDGKLCKVA